LAGIIGSVFATALSFAVREYILEIKLGIRFQFDDDGRFNNGVFGDDVGAISSFDVLFQKPLATLRSQ
jgi:hypothetical protein